MDEKHPNINLKKIEEDITFTILKLLQLLNIEGNSNINKEELIAYINTLSRAVPQLIQLIEKIGVEKNTKHLDRDRYNKILENDTYIQKSLELLNFLNN
ncbi:MAG TPA: hypothetical protein PLE30_09440 [Candidatus Kapabacteria bacterium]|nr:hypothetical protein [Candidatus Kapabacteria bacterium]